MMNRLNRAQTQAQGQRLLAVGSARQSIVALTITPTYGVEYERRKGASTTSVNGPIKTFSKENFTVSVFGISTTFVIDKPPYTDDAHTRMKIDGVVLTRVDAQ